MSTTLLHAPLGAHTYTLLVAQERRTREEVQRLQRSRRMHREVQCGAGVGRKGEEEDVSVSESESALLLARTIPCRVSLKHLVKIENIFAPCLVAVLAVLCTVFFILRVSISAQCL